MCKKGFLKLLLVTLSVVCLAGCTGKPGKTQPVTPSDTPSPSPVQSAAELFADGGLRISNSRYSKDDSEFRIEIHNSKNVSVMLEKVAINGVGLDNLRIEANGYLSLSKDDFDAAKISAVNTPELVLTVDGREVDRVTRPDDFLDGMKMRITEIMGKSRYSIIDEDGDPVDWVELKNTGDKDVNLASFGLSDNFSKPFKFILPDVTLKPGGFLLVCLSGKEKAYSADSPYIHASFKLSEDDDGLILTNPYEITADKVENIVLYENLSLGRTPGDDSKWQLYSLPTPGRENAQAGYNTFEEYEKAKTNTIIINEVCAVSSDNVTGLPVSDWIELRNVSNEAVNLKGYRISKDIKQLDMYTFPDVTIQAGGYLVIDAGDVASVTVGKLNTGFKISSSGATLYLTDPNGYPIDVFETGIQRANVTSGRNLEGNPAVREFFTVPTRGKENSEGMSGYAPKVLISSDTTTLDAESHLVTLTSSLPDGKIYYTLDGSTPTEASTLYSGPFMLKESCVVKAVNMRAGLVPSDVSTRTFLCDGRVHSLGVVCVSSDPTGLYSEETGIFALGPNASATYPNEGANFWQEWQRACTFEYYDGGELAVEFDAGMKVHGQYTRARESKSFSINLKDAFGPKSVYYPFFGEDGVKEFSNLVIRSAGQDQSQTMIRDCFIARSVRGVVDVDVQDEKPVALYINGQYQGLYFIREKINEQFIETYTGIKEDNLDIIKGNDILDAGDRKRLYEMINYIKSHDMSTPESLAFIEKNVDLDEWMNFWIIETYFGNADSGNIRRYTSKDNSVRWRWILYDMDMAIEKYTWKYDLFEHILNPAGHGYANLFFTYMTYNLLVVNPVSRERFLEKYAEMMKTTLNPERLMPICREFIEEVRSEMVYHGEVKREISYAQWDKDSSDLLNIILPTRHELVKQQIKKNFGLSDERMKELFGE